MPPYEKISFEDATRIIYFNTDNDRMFKAFMEDLMLGSDEPYKVVPLRWYEAYRNHLSENKKQK